jgi:CRP-like cAMP-binding protein
MHTCELAVARIDPRDLRAEAKKRTLRSASRNIGALPKHLPRCEEVIEPESTACPCCSSPLHRITHQDIAAMVGSVREVVQRALKELERGGAIELERSPIRVRDIARLQRFCEPEVD